MVKNISVKSLILLNNITFILLFFIISWFIRPAHDDFYSMYMIRKFGVMDGILYQYEHWCTRFVGVFISFTITSLNINMKYFLFNCILFSFFGFSIYRILKIYFSEKSYFEIWNYSIFIFSAIFYSTLNIGETWFWLSSNSSYALSVSILFFGLGSILKKQKNYWDIFFLIISFFLIGGLNEVLSTFIIFISIFSSLFFELKLNFSSWQKNKTATALFSMSIALSILILGKGNSVREDFFEEISFFESIVLNFKLVAIILIKKILPKIPIFVICALGLSIVFPKVVKQLNEIRLKDFVKLVLLFISILFVYELPVTYKTQDIMAIRVLLPISIILLIFSTYILSSVHILKNHHNQILTICLSLQIVSLVWQAFTTKKYAHAYDDRIAFLEKHKTSRDTIKLIPLPNSGWIYSSEISSNSDSFENQHMIKGLELNCQISLKNNAVKAKD